MPPLALRPDEARAVLGAVLGDRFGPRTALMSCVAMPLSRRGRQRVVRYDFAARLPGPGEIFRDRWVGKFYPRAEDARRAGAVLRELAATGCCRRGRMLIPAVLGHYPPRRVVMLRFEPGESVIPRLAEPDGAAATAIGRALAALHAAQVAAPEITAAALLDALVPRLEQLSDTFPEPAMGLRRELKQLRRSEPPDPPAAVFLHGDLGPAQLRWQEGRLVLLDFDKCGRGDPALDLGTLLTQLYRVARRRPEKLPDFAGVRASILAAYAAESPPDRGLARRVTWYERAALLRKILLLLTDTGRGNGRGERERRREEGVRLLTDLASGARVPGEAGDGA